jgi:NAD+ synthase
MNNLTDYSKVSHVMVNHMKDYFKSCGLHSAVLGISGGIDSTLVAVLLHNVSNQLKEECYDFTFYGVSLPTKTTNSKEFWVSQLVGNTFCDKFEVVEMDEVSSVVDSWLGEWKTNWNPSEKIEPIRSGNAKSRLRMIYLYDYAKKKNGIVIGTDNYTEYLLGFSTIGGDALFDYNPIQYLWKTEVFEMSKMFQFDYSYEDITKAAAIKESLALKPMDGLGISNDDMVQIGARNYYDVDDILKWYLDNKDTDRYPDNFKSSVDGSIIQRTAMERVISRHKNSEFKRNHPVVINRDKYE